MPDLDLPRGVSSRHLLLHRRPALLTDGSRVCWDGSELTTYRLSPQQQAEPFSVSFETVVDRLAELPQMFVEPDGSFVWVAARDSELAWQLDGVVNDRADRVSSVELKGHCPPEVFQTLLRVFDWPETPLLVQLVRAALFVEVADFLQWIERPGGA